MAKPTAKPLPPLDPPGDEAAAPVPAEGGAATPRLVDILNALKLVDAQELEARVAQLKAAYPDAELLIERARAFLSSKINETAINGILSQVLAELIAAAQSGKSPVVHDPVDLA